MPKQNEKFGICQRGSTGFSYVRAAVFIDMERGVDGKAVETPMQSKTNFIFCFGI